jgi:hypothetical protein
LIIIRGMTNKRIKFSLLLNKGIINKTSREHSGVEKDFHGNIYMQLPPSHSRKYTRTETKEKEQQQYSAPERGRPLADPDWCIARRRFPLYRARFRHEQGRALTLFPAEGAAIYIFPANNHLKNTKSRLGQRDV